MYAPVIVFAYRRLDKLKDCIESLMACDGADQSELFIFADGPKGTADEEDVRKVVAYLEGVVKESKFKKTEFIKSEYNCGIVVSVINGVSDVIEEYGKVIVVEDDLTVARDFLTYSNRALDFYENDKEVWSVTGYTQPLRALKKYPHDVYYGYRGCTYGWGTWRDRWETVDWEMTSYSRFLSSKKMKKRFCLGGGDLPVILRNQMTGRTDSWGIIWYYAQSMQGRYTVYPKSSFVINNGADGSGTNETVLEEKNDYSHKYGDSVKFEHLKINKRLMREFRLRHTDTLYNKIKRNIKKIFRR